MAVATVIYLTLLLKITSFQFSHHRIGKNVTLNICEETVGQFNDILWLFKQMSTVNLLISL